MTDNVKILKKEYSAPVTGSNVLAGQSFHHSCKQHFARPHSSTVNNDNTAQM